jgi:hypothetical protein
MVTQNKKYIIFCLDFKCFQVLNFQNFINHGHVKCKKNSCWKSLTSDWKKIWGISVIISCCRFNVTLYDWYIGDSFKYFYHSVLIPYSYDYHREYNVIVADVLKCKTKYSHWQSKRFVRGSVIEEEIEVWTSTVYNHGLTWACISLVLRSLCFTTSLDFGTSPPPTFLLLLNRTLKNEHI